MFGFNNLYMYLNEDFEPCFHTDFDVAWLANFAIGGAVIEFYSVSEDSAPVFCDVVTLTYPVAKAEHVASVVREYVEAEQED